MADGFDFDFRKTDYWRVAGPDGEEVSKHTALEYAVESALRNGIALQQNGVYKITPPGYEVEIMGFGVRSAPPPDNQPPGPPFLTATATGSTSVSLSWTAASDNVGVVGYTLQRSLDNSNWTTLQDDIIRTYNDSGRSPSTPYYYRVRAYDAAGNLSAWATAQATTQSAISGNWLDDVGLLWADGVEPSGNEASLYPVQPGNRVWYVDANASSNGDGSAGSPFWSFVELNTGTSLSGYTPGDHIYVTGDFTATKQATRGAMGPSIVSTAWAGSRTSPTVIRSWPGRARAKFDGEFSATNMVDFEVCASGTSAADRGLVIINVECTRNWGISLYVGGNSYWGLCRVISCYAHDCIGNGPNSSMGGIHIGARVTNCDVEDRNFETSWNFYNSDGTLNDATLDNTAGLMVHVAEDSIGATINVYRNYFHNEFRACGHKWTGVASFEYYNNYIRDCHGAAFRCRNVTSNVYHHNLVVDCGTFLSMTEGNRITRGVTDTRYDAWYNNTIVGCTSEAYYDDGGEVITAADVNSGTANIFYNPTLSTKHLALEQYGASSFYEAGFTYSGNCIYTNNAAAYAEVNNVNYTKAGFVAKWSDTGSVYADPLFTNPATGDYTLQAGSSAAGMGAF